MPDPALPEMTVEQLDAEADRCLGVWEAPIPGLGDPVEVLTDDAASEQLALVERATAAYDRLVAIEAEKERRREACRARIAVLTAELERRRSAPPSPR